MEVNDEYVYDDEYVDMFRKFVLNISLKDLENLTSLEFQEYYQDDTDTVNIVDDDMSNRDSWIFALNLISGLGILLNCLLLFLLIVDFVIDRQRRFWTRHWLLCNSAVTHIAYLGIGIYMRQFATTLGQFERTCLIMKHTEKTIQFVIILYYAILAVNVLANVVKPNLPCGKRNVVFWVVLILFIMVCGNLTVLGIFTMRVQISILPRCDLDSSQLLQAGSVYLIVIVTFFLPYGIILTLAFSALLCTCIQQRKPATPTTTNSDSRNERSHSAIFIFLTSTAGFLLLLPYYLCKVPEIREALVVSPRAVDGDSLTYFTEFIKLTNYAMFPVFCLCLKEVRDVYKKATKNE